MKSIHTVPPLPHCSSSPPPPQTKTWSFSNFYKSRGDQSNIRILMFFLSVCKFCQIQNKALWNNLSSGMFSEYSIIVEKVDQHAKHGTKLRQFFTSDFLIWFTDECWFLWINPSKCLFYSKKSIFFHGWYSLIFLIGLIHFDILLNIPPPTGAKHLKLCSTIKLSYWIISLF